MRTVAAIEADPRNTQRIYDHVPGPWAEMLASEEFEFMCADSLASVADGMERLPFARVFPIVAQIFASLEAEPPLRADARRMQQLANCFVASGAGTIGVDEFSDFVRFAVAVQYLEAIGSAG